MPAATKANRKANGPMVAKKRALARAQKSVKNLENSVDQLKKKIKTKNTQLNRMEKHIEKYKLENQTPGSGVTPGKITQMDMDQLNLTPKRSKLVKRKLLFSNVLMERMKNVNTNTTTKKRHVLSRLLGGKKVLKKYRLVSEVSRKVGISRSSLHSTVTTERKNAVFDMRQEIRTGIVRK